MAFLSAEFANGLRLSNIVEESDNWSVITAKVVG